MKIGKSLTALFVLLMVVVSQGAHQSNARKKSKSQSQSSTADSGWPVYGRDPGGSRYSPLAEINRENVNNLKIAWTYRTGAAGVKAASARNAAFEATPILVDGSLYLTTPYSRVIALDAATGKPCADFGENGQIDLTRDVLTRCTAVRRNNNFLPSLRPSVPLSFCPSEVQQCRRIESSTMR